jgi:hypothetical protein
MATTKRTRFCGYLWVHLTEEQWDWFAWGWLAFHDKVSRSAVAGDTSIQRHFWKQGYKMARYFPEKRTP